MATVVITIVTPDSAAMVADQLQVVGSSPYTLTSPNAQDRVARYVDGVAFRAFGQTSFTVAIS